MAGLDWLNSANHLKDTLFAGIETDSLPQREDQLPSEMASTAPRPKR